MAWGDYKGVGVRNEIGAGGLTDWLKSLDFYKIVTHGVNSN
jgi:hypothetical protein